ncbi:MAG TPA: Hsp20/alpha crystallin family protein [Steroidobacteraceae bacterium]|nr:Hsp20/alpha crystallin family protein [Steroidobacteraceae bacterium]
MNLTRWDPFAGFDTLFNRVTPNLPRLFMEEKGGIGVEFTPLADIVETGKEYLVRAELPGLKKEDVKVTMTDGFLTIEGERKREQEEKGEKVHRVECYYGRFARNFALPDNVKAEAVRCECKDGVLTVHIPKSEYQRPREILVQ